MDTNRLQEIIKEAGFESRRYSGRGMYGAECVAFNTYDLVGEVAEIVASVDTDEERYELVKAFKKSNTDVMGTGTVIYFPTYKYPKAG
jgi:hypothetical protein